MELGKLLYPFPSYLFLFLHPLYRLKRSAAKYLGVSPVLRFSLQIQGHYHPQPGSPIVLPPKSNHYAGTHRGGALQDLCSLKLICTTCARGWIFFPRARGGWKAVAFAISTYPKTQTSRFEVLILADKSWKKKYYSRRRVV